MVPDWLKAASFSLLVFSASVASAENTWNIVTSEESDAISRDAGSELIEGTILVLEALKAAEQRQYQLSFAQLRVAEDQYRTAAVLLDSLSARDDSFVKINLEPLSNRDVVILHLWYQEFLEDPFDAVDRNFSPFVDLTTNDFDIEAIRSELASATASDLLKVASLHCEAIASVLLDIEVDTGIPETGKVPPSRLAVLTTQSAMVIAVGNIATEVFP